MEPDNDNKRRVINLLDLTYCPRLRDDLGIRLARFAAGRMDDTRGYAEIIRALKAARKRMPTRGSQT